ncbi:MAG: hypothetical protein FJX57_23960 [Alphaproteobacteria bacterium]|nr:hypothetical protein [Alphaproteobacteria bacterium]
MTGNSMFRPVLALALSLSLVAGDALAASRCLTPQEKTAFQVRMLQTELMVATLTCRGMSKHDFSKQYGSFVETHRAGLRSHSEVFQGHFKRSYGGGGATQMDRYVTSLANDYSRSSMMGQGAFCDQQGPLFEKAAAVQPKDLAGFANERAAGRSIGVAACGEGSAGQATKKPAAKKKAPAKTDAAAKQ